MEKIERKIAGRGDKTLPRQGLLPEGGVNSAKKKVKGVTNMLMCSG